MPSSTVTLPAGIVPVKVLTTGDILTGNRTTTIRYDLLTRTEAAKGTLTGVLGGTVDYTASASVHGGGALTVVDKGQSVDWLNDRIRPVITVAGLPEQPLGVFLPSEAPETWAGTGRTWALKMLDKCTVLDQDKVTATYAVPAGTVITTQVASIITGTGETNVAITPSAATLAGDLVWPPATSKLRIVNDLLAAAGYASLYCDAYGQFRAEPYARPATRPIAYEFIDDKRSIYSPDFTRDRDVFAVPNTFIAVGQGDGVTAALTSTAINNNPASPYSTVSRGTPGFPRTIAASESGIEAADQATLDAYARRRLIELTSVTSAPVVLHAFVPGLMFSNAVRLRRVPAGIDARHVVSKTVISLDPTALVKSTLQEVVDL